MTGMMASTAAFAQPKPLDTVDQSEHVTAVNASTVEDALSVVTGNHIKGADQNGTPTLNATATNGLRFEVNFRACEATAENEQVHCKGMYMISTWDPAGAEQSAAMMPTIAAFLRDNPSVNAGQGADGITLCNTLCYRRFRHQTGQSRFRICQFHWDTEPKAMGTTVVERHRGP